MDNQFFQYLLTLLLFLIIDLLWLGMIARNFYSQQLGDLRSVSTNWLAAGAFYLIFNIGLMLFAVIPALRGGGIRLALGHGALYGFFTYATYDLTNLATLEDWPWKMSVVDILWGTALCASVSCLSVYLGTLLLR